MKILLISYYTRCAFSAHTLFIFAYKKMLILPLLNLVFMPSFRLGSSSFLSRFRDETAHEQYLLGTYHYLQYPIPESFYWCFLAFFPWYVNKGWKIRHYLRGVSETANFFSFLSLRNKIHTSHHLHALFHLRVLLQWDGHIFFV